MPRFPAPRILLLLAALCAGSTAAAAPAQAAPKRIVALEWDSIENLRTLGIKPVGGADLKGYRQYVAGGLPSGIKDVGRRQEPSLERIAKLKPDLIIVPNYRSGENLRTLKRISKVLVTNPYPGGGRDAHFRAMVNDFKRTAAAVGRSGRARSVLGRMERRLKQLRGTIRKRNRDGIRLTIATPGGSSGSPSARLFTDNSAAATIVRRLGMRNAWTATPARYGFSTVGVEALRKVQSGYLAFVYPKASAAQIRRFTGQRAFQQLRFTKRKRISHLAGNTWLFGGPVSATIFADRLTARLR